MHATAGEQFDALIHFDETHAVQPLERAQGGSAAGGLPDTDPWAD